ncbi:hypothetical protein C1645_754180 [Glomus cerebriforme]|uniref:Attractin/MKLN-like beta-propeller domain-containing protein n=1 Tax=Glomus cerebriforme TaxID=658196 RepID=A0A397THA1_9GLOM|nr:hypothetical protein C1645_754180 [Glomus cerebriforme]
MLKNSLIYFVLLLLLVEINGQAFTPYVRHLHTATLIQDKLYILSGFDDVHGSEGIGGRQFFYLDVSAPLNTQQLSWNDLSSNDVVPSHIGAAAVKGGANNNTLILYGGRNLTNVEIPASVFMFDPQSNSWSIPIITGEFFIKRRSLTAIIDNNGKIYLFGGRLLVYNNYVNDMLVLDSINLSWGKGNSLNGPSPRVNYGATLLPNQNILYIGGADNLSESLPLDMVYLYDTINNNWTTVKTFGTIPSSRFGITSVLGLDGQQVIVFGGKGVDIDGSNSLYTLNINTFEWIIPNVSGNIPGNRYMHKANVIGNYMVVTFGFGYNETDSDVLLLDISNNDEFKWTTDFIPPKTLRQLSAKKTKDVIIGIIVGSIIGGVLLLSIGFFILYKWNKNKKVQVGVANIPDNNNKLENQSGKGEVLTTDNKVINSDQETRQV